MIVKAGVKPVFFAKSKLCGYREKTIFAPQILKIPNG
jgi:hypothetical protein